MTNFWKIECNVCGVNCDLLTDKYQRIICRDCLNENEFKETESVLTDFDEEEDEISSESNQEIQEVNLRTNDVPLPIGNLARKLQDDFRI